MTAVSTALLFPGQAIADPHPPEQLSFLNATGGSPVATPQQGHGTSKNVKAEQSGESCIPTLPGSPERRAGVAETCTAITPPTSRESVTAKAPRSPSMKSTGAVCSIAKPGYWHFERLSACLRDLTVNFTLRGEKDEVLGTAILYVSTSATLNPRSGSWDEQIEVEATQYKGKVKSLNVAASVTCTSNCKATGSRPWTGARALTDGQVASGTVSYSNVPAVGVADSAIVKYNLYITQTGTTPTHPNVDWSNPDAIRCDSALTVGGNTSTGCAVPSITPTLELPVSKYGAAAITYGWGQRNLPGAWGRYSSTRMTRALDGEQRRKFTCGEKSSVPFIKKLDIVPTDSCDEFPFASTEQGGTDGGKCAEIVPLLEDGKWKFYEADPKRPVTKTEPCVRAHVPIAQNKRAGTTYSNFIQNVRLIEKDPFYLDIPDYEEMTR